MPLKDVLELFQFINAAYTFVVYRLENIIDFLAVLSCIYLVKIQKIIVLLNIIESTIRACTIYYKHKHFGWHVLHDNGSECTRTFLVFLLKTILNIN